MANLKLLKTVKELRKKTSKKPFMEAVILFGVFVLILLLVFLFVRALYEKQIATYLPAEKTTAYVEVNDLSLPPKAYRSSLFRSENFSNLLQGLLDIDYREAVGAVETPLGIAFIESGLGKNDPVFFARIKTRHQLIRYLESQSLQGDEVIKKGEGKYPIYSLQKGLPWKFVFIYPYAFIAESEMPLQTITTAHRQGALMLEDNPDFADVMMNLPKQVWAKAYVNFSQLALNNDNLMSFIEPVQLIADRFGFTLRKGQEGFHFNQYLKLNDRYQDQQGGFTDSTPFAYSLTDYIPAQDLAFYMGGSDLSAEWQNTLETTAQLNPAYGVILEGIVRAQMNKVFGENVDLRNDLYPLFEGEYAVSVHQPENQPVGIELMLAYDDREFIQTKLDKLYEGFRFLAAQFTPRVQVFVLPDGTESRELVADPDSVQESSDEYKGFDIECIEVTESAYGFCYSLTDHLILLSNQKKLIQESIDLSLNPGEELAQSPAFREALSNLSRVSDEITHIEFDHTLQLLEAKPIGQLLSSFLQPFESATWVKHYFTDGVSTEGFVLLK